MAGSFELEDVSVAYSGETAVAGVCAGIAPNQVTALIGPSGCGKSTLLKTLNRMNDLRGGLPYRGLTITLDGDDVYRTIDADQTCAGAWAWCSSSRTRSP